MAEYVANLDKPAAVEHLPPNTSKPDIPNLPPRWLTDLNHHEVVTGYSERFYPEVVIDSTETFFEFATIFSEKKGEEMSLEDQNLEETYPFAAMITRNDSSFLILRPEEGHEGTYYIKYFYQELFTNELYRI